MSRLLPCLLAFAVLFVGLTVAQSRIDPVDTAEARALATCPTSKRPRAKFARCYIDRSKAVVDNVWTGTGAKEYFDGRAGNDTILARGGDDTITGGPGMDTINTGDGNNRVNVKDGEVDRVVCGKSGRNVVVRDSFDKVSTNCSRGR